MSTLKADIDHGEGKSSNLNQALDSTIKAVEEAQLASQAARKERDDNEASITEKKQSLVRLDAQRADYLDALQRGLSNHLARHEANIKDVYPKHTDVCQGNQEDFDLASASVGKAIRDLHDGKIRRIETMV